MAPASVNRPDLPQFRHVVDLTSGLSTSAASDSTGSGMLASKTNRDPFKHMRNKSDERVDEARWSAQHGGKHIDPSSSSICDNFEVSEPASLESGSWSDYGQKHKGQPDTIDGWTHSSIKTLLRKSIKWEAEKETWKKMWKKEIELRKKMQSDLAALKQTVHAKVDPENLNGPEESGAPRRTKRRR